MYVQDIGTEILGGIDNTELAVHVEAEATREAVHTVARAEAEVTRQAMHVEAESTRGAVDAVAQVRHY